MDISSMARMTGLVLGAGAFVATAQGGTLYQQMSGTIQSGHDAVNDAQADDFVLNESSILTSATISIFELDPNGADAWDGTIQYFIFEDSGSKPGGLLASGMGNVTNETPTGTNSFGWLFSQVSFEFEAGVPLDEDNYWFGVILSDGMDDGDKVNWQAISGQVGSRSKKNSNPALPHLGWTNNAFDFSFELQGVVPTPGVATTLGLGGLCLTRRRRR